MKTFPRTEYLLFLPFMKNSMKNYSLFLLLLWILASCNSSQKIKPFWTEAQAPEVIGERLIGAFFERGDFPISDSYGFTAIHYAEACAAFGVARLAGELGQTDVIEQLTERYMRVITDSIPNTANHVDANVYGILPFELYQITGDPAFLEQALYLANSQWESPRADGLTNQARFWIDDVWMIGSLQVQAYRITKNEMYLQRAALMASIYLNRLQQNNGLFHHGPGIPFFWGRGNGWVAAGLAEILAVLPETNIHYHTITEGYQKMMDALLEYQAENGMWRQLIDVDSAWYESSSTAMFGYALVIGVKCGILKEKKYTEAYQKAWLALTAYVDEKGRVHEVCAGTGQQNDIHYYLNRPRNIGDDHGQAPMLWLAWQLISTP
jgi:unsaturated rhamnogalacturonyl hydrolase